MNNICAITIVGGVARNIEVKQLQNTNLGTFSIAWGTYQKGANERNEKSNFIDVTIFGKTVENLSKYLVKGCKVAISGRLEQQTWNDQAGNQKSKHVVIADNVQIISSMNNSSQQQGFNQQQPQFVPNQQYQQQQPQFTPNQQYQQMSQNFNPQQGMNSFPEDMPF